jgi:hypothetical protein
MPACAATSRSCWRWKKFKEAEEVGLTDLSPEAARANVEAIRQMIAQNDSWRELRTPAKAAEPKAKAPTQDAG